MLSLHPANSSAFRGVILESRARKELALSKADETQTPAPPYAKIPPRSLSGHYTGSDPSKSLALGSAQFSPQLPSFCVASSRHAASSPPGFYVSLGRSDAFSGFNYIFLELTTFVTWYEQVL